MMNATTIEMTAADIVRVEGFVRRGGRNERIIRTELGEH